MLLGQHRDLHGVLDEGGADRGKRVVHDIPIQGVPDQGGGRRACKGKKGIPVKQRSSNLVK